MGGDRARLSRRTFVARAAAWGGICVGIVPLLDACRREGGGAVPPPPTAAAAAAVPLSPVLPGPAISWLGARAIALATAEPDEQGADPLPLQAVIGDARIVALGEATHGTHEFFTVKHRLVAFLVAELGFTVLALEADWAAVVPLDRWVRTGDGDPVALLAALELWSINTREMLDLLRWLRAYNERRSAAPVVGLAGFDARSPNRAAALVLAYIGDVDPAAAPDFATAYTPLSTYDAGAYARATPEARARGRAGVGRAHATLLARRAVYEGASSPAAFARALQGARVAVQAEADWAEPDTRTRFAARDRFLAENAAWVLEQAGPGARIALWAHNEHVGTTPWADVPAPSRIPSMGGHLRERYGAGLVTCGLSFGEGTFRALAVGEGSLGAHRAAPPPPDSYEAACRQTGLPRFLVDLRTVPHGTVAGDWLAGPHPLRSIGAGYDGAHPERSVYAVALPEKFDLFLYLQATTPSAPLFPFGPLADLPSQKVERHGAAHVAKAATPRHAHG